MKLPGQLRRLARRHAHLADAMVALAVFTATAVTTFAGHRAGVAIDHVAALGWSALACGALAVRRRWPLTAMVVAVAAVEPFFSAAGNGSGVLIVLAPCIAIYTVAEQAERRRALIICGFAVAAFVIVHAVQHPGIFGLPNLAFAAIGGLAIAAGDSSRNRRAYLAEVERRAAHSERERELDARRRVAQERLRIARDLHDSVGHHLALISVQSDVAARAVDDDADAARQALGHVKSASRKALEELRDTVSLLRQPGDPVITTEIPVPGLDGLGELLSELRASGLTVDCQVTGVPVELPPAADLTAYRVIQESLTNVRKHSAGRRARLAVGYDRDELSITVDDLGAAGAGAVIEDAALVPPPKSVFLSSGRHGIAGMRERVLAIGGRFAADSLPRGAFRVAATVPYQPADPTREAADPTREAADLTREAAP
jgi:signal transduction histidine kinase